MTVSQPVRAPRRRTALALAAAAAALVVTGCGGGPTLPGAAATVGDDRISVEQLQSQVDSVLTFRGGPENAAVRDQLPTITQQVLSGEVQRALVARAVQRTNLPVDEQAIADQVARIDPKVLDGQGVTFITPQTLPQFVHDQLVIAQLGATSWDSLAVVADLTTATDQADAEAKARRMAESPESSRAVVDEAKAQGQQTQVGYPLSPAVLEGLAGSPLFAAAEGSGIAFRLDQQWQAARIVSRTTTAPKTTSADAVDASQAQASSTYALGVTLLQELAGNPEVRVNPRYGTWDPYQGQVVNESDPRSVVFSPRS
ncbi:SurA N-terminal domain-containing protein [Rhodococcus sp. X156]|uniref:SurA N-terminal domain-containing protein n=1 Tax=Rhodococcus sp. X156 TaxID=2499145 RepID=UPI000FDBB54A|nr:SurA N-terminal domain-containing protein [Rhodococcus sp. X156]